MPYVNTAAIISAHFISIFIIHKRLPKSEQPWGAVPGRAVGSHFGNYILAAAAAPEPQGCFQRGNWGSLFELFSSVSLLPLVSLLPSSHSTSILTSLTYQKRKAGNYIPGFLPYFLSEPLDAQLQGVWRHLSSSRFGGICSL